MFVVQNNSIVETSNLQTELEHTKEQFENCIIKKENEYAKLWNDCYKKCKEYKFDKISYDKAYNDMQQKIERLQAQLGDIKGKSKDTSCVSDTLTPLSQKLENENVKLEFQVIQICLWCVDSGCFKHMTGNLQLLINFVWKFLGTVRFRNDHVAAILGFGDLQWGNVLITRVYFVEGLGHNLFSVGQFCDSDLEVAFRKNTYFVRNLEGVYLLKGNHTTTFTPSISMKWPMHLQFASWLVLQFKNQVLKEYFDSVGISHQASSVKTPQQNGVVERRNQTMVEAARTIKTPYELINGRKLDISFLHVFGALCYPKNDREDIGKLDAKGDIGLFIGYSATSCAYRFYNRRTKKIIEMMNVTFDELSAMAFEQRISKPGFQSMNPRQISSGLDLTYAPSIITSQKLTEREVDLLFEAMYDDYIGGQ
nr:integrase, catalytic region, zinc finger, CCHC-type, peptidase aspartic, catalytic [Tanacetum cinerariifolium]